MGVGAAGCGADAVLPDQDDFALPRYCQPAGASDVEDVELRVGSARFAVGQDAGDAGIADEVGQQFGPIGPNPVSSTGGITVSLDCWSMNVFKSTRTLSWGRMPRSVGNPCSSSEVSMLSSASTRRSEAGRLSSRSRGADSEPSTVLNFAPVWMPRKPVTCQPLGP